MDPKFLSGFSRLSKEEKLKIISSNLDDDAGFVSEIESLNHRDNDKQILLEQFSENTLGNYPLPYGVAPNFLINDRFYTIPMVTEESSVVAAASAAARFWADKGGFHANVRGSVKIGQIHFCWHSDRKILMDSLENLKKFLVVNSSHLTQSMIDRGGGIGEIELLDFTSQLEDYYQLRIGFETVDSMGANFINSVLEEMASLMLNFFNNSSGIGEINVPAEIIMAVLSNYTPNCLVECYVETTFTSFGKIADKMSCEEFALKFKKAVDIASIDPYRAVTHNKGIFNGIDAVLLATANDFRAVEASGHAFAARSGKYTSLSKVGISGNIFRMSLELPLAVGTVGGLTSLHPLAKWSFEIMNKPTAHELMMIIASTGLATTFSAVRSLITHGIQHGHMNMHLGNILSFLGTGAEDRNNAIEYFKNHKVSYHLVQQFLTKQKNI